MRFSSIDRNHNIERGSQRTLISEELLQFGQFDGLTAGALNQHRAHVAKLVRLIEKTDAFSLQLGDPG